MFDADESGSQVFKKTIANTRSTIQDSRNLIAAIDMKFYRNCNYFSNHNEIFSEMIIKSNDNN